MSPLPLPRSLIPLASTLALGCATEAPTQPADSASPAPMDAAVVRSSATSAGLTSVPAFDPHRFVSVVDNKYFPLTPGTRFIYVGTEDGEPLKNITDVLYTTRTVLGVKTTVVLDRLYKSGSLAEKTFDYYAEDDDGNVWYFGEDTKELENGKVISTAGTWLAGSNGAKPGIFMPSQRTVGQTTQQEFAPGVAEDKSTFLALNVTVTVPYGTLAHCLKTKDFTPLEPGAYEYKFYCPDIGLVSGRDVVGGTARLALKALLRP